MPPNDTRPPGRAVLRLAGVFTQLISASCLLLGTIAFVLVQQNKSGGSAYVIAWAVAAMTALVFGGLMARGNLIAVIGAAVLDAGFSIVLFALDAPTLRGILRVLPAPDIEMIGDALTGAAGAMVAVAILCLIAIPQALRYARWLVRESEAAGESGYIKPGSTQPGVTGAMPAQAGTLHSGMTSLPGGRPVQQGSMEPVLASSTARGWAPPPTGKLSVWNLPAAAPEEARSRRRMYFALAGFAIGFGAGIGVLVSTTTKARSIKVTQGSGSGSGTATPIDKPTPDAAIVVTNPTTDSSGPIGEGGSAEDIKPVRTLVDAQREAIAKGDLKALGATLAPTAFGFGIDADEVAEGRAAVLAQLERDLGVVPDGGFTVESKFQAIGEDNGHAWIAMELELSAPNGSPRRIAITELAGILDGKWTVTAWHWAIPVPDATAEKLAILKTLPVPKPITTSVSAPKDLEAAAKSAFTSRSAFAAARSERDDGFNFGSAPGERIVGGSNIKRVFGKLKAEIRVHDGMHIVGGNTWDPAQEALPFIGFAAANVDFTAKTRAATDLTQTFRVLAVFLKEGSEWKIVQTQWSHGGPIR